MPPPLLPETACLSDAKLALEAFIDAVPAVTSRPAPAALPIERKLPSAPNNPLTALEAFAALSELRPKDAILVNETASNFADLIQFWPIQKADTYYTFASGGLGWGSARGGGSCACREEDGNGPPCGGCHWRWRVSILSSRRVYRGSTEAEGRLHCAVQRRVRHPQGIRRFGEDTECPRPGPSGPGRHLCRQGLRLRHRSRQNHRRKSRKHSPPRLKADGPTLIAIPIARQERPLVPPVD